MRLVLLLLCLALTGCASVRELDRGLLSTFSMIGPGQWEMVANAGGRNAHSEEQERVRLGWIDDYVRANGCSTYEVKDRLVTRAPPQRAVLGIKASGDTIRYAGTCR